jgi:hypothetical protein
MSVWKVFLSLWVICWLGACDGADKENPISKAGALYVVFYQLPPVFVGEETRTDRRAADEVLMGAGVSFPPGASILSGEQTSALSIRNTEENHKLIQEFFDREFPGWSIEEPPFDSMPELVPDDPFGDSGNRDVAD